MYIGITINKGLIKKDKWYIRKWFKNGSVVIIKDRKGYNTKRQAQKVIA